MNAKNLIWVVVGTISVTAIGIAIGYFVFSDASSEEVETSSTSVQGAATDQAGGLSVVENGTSLRNGTFSPTGAAPEQAAASQIAGPESFGAFDEFVGSTDLRFQELQIGSGEAVEPGDNVAVVYTGWLTTGEVFDLSRTNEQGQIEAFAFTLGAGQVIQGWDQGVSGMNVGGKRRLIIPPSLGYGEAGQGAIPPNSVLVFDVEVVSVETPPQTQPGL